MIAIDLELQRMMRKKSKPARMDRVFFRLAITLAAALAGLSGGLGAFAQEATPEEVPIQVEVWVKIQKKKADAETRIKTLEESLALIS